MTAIAHVTLPGVLEKDPKRVSFGQTGFVERQADGSYHVWFGDVLLGVYDNSDPVGRDVLIALVARSVDVRREDVALAFRTSPATVGRVLTRLSRAGMAGVAQKKERGPLKLTPPLRRQIYALFDKGLTIRATHRRVAKSLSYGRVQWLHKQWQADKAATASDETSKASVQLVLGDGSAEPSIDSSLQQEMAPAANDTETELTPTPSTPADVCESPRQQEQVPVLDVISGEGSADAGFETVDAAETDLSQAVPLDDVNSREWVQHLGSWLMLAMLQAMGLYAIATKLAPDAKQAARLRVALDATAIALSIGQKCVEGLRRLQTKTHWILLRYRGAVSPKWARSVLGRFAKKESVMFQAAFAKKLLEGVLHDDQRVFLYVDNHLRPYTGKHKIRKGWHMQDKRAVPGVSDYYVHDEEGCPLWRLSIPAHDSLPAWLRPIVEFVALALGPKAVPVMIFDRGGSHPNAMAELRDLGAEFITYECKPFQILPRHVFEKKLKITSASTPNKPIVIRYSDVADKNLHHGRGRIRRIALKMPDGAQINVLAASTLPTEVIIRKILARWACQENQFKHEVERWGINQLDGRSVEDYPEDAVIPNPGRRKLEYHLKLTQAAEGRARCALARLEPEDPKREGLEKDLERVIHRQDELKSQRPKLPAKAPLKDTSLAGVLVRHPQEYKTVVDTLRIALANAEADLAQRLARHLSRPREAKKTLANLFAAPGKVTVRVDSVSVRLAPAGTAGERLAFARFLRHVNRLKLTLPGDEARRRLRFSLLKYSNG